MSRLAVATLVLSLGLSVPAGALAQDTPPVDVVQPPPPPEPAPPVAPPETSARDQEGRMLFRAGTLALDDGRFEDALAHFERAYELTRRAELLYNIGLTAVTLQRNDRAISAFEQFLRDTPGTPRRREVEARLHSLRATRAHGATTSASASGSHARVRSGPGAAPWILVGASGAAVVGGALLFATGLLANSTVNDAVPGTPWMSVSADYDRGPMFTTLGAIIGAVGLAGVAAGIVCVVSGSDGEERARVAFGLDGVSIGGRL